MARKFISLATAIVILDVYLRSQLYSNDPLFLFASSNPVVNIGLIAIACVVVAYSFMDKFHSWLSYATCVSLAAVLGLVGLAGFFISNITFLFASVLLPMDYMFLMESAVILAICALSYSHNPYPYKGKRPTASQLANRLKLALPVPKLPHSPNLTHTSTSGSH